MASTFPAAIANEPPPLDGSSEDEDSEEFRSHGLKLDVPSGEPTPVSTPFKRPFNKSSDKIKPIAIEPDAALEGLTSTVSSEENSSSPEQLNADDGIDNDRRNIHSDEIEERVNGVEEEEEEDEVTETEAETKEESKYNTLFQEESPSQDVDTAKETNHCDSSTEINYTNSNIPLSPEICTDTSSLSEEKEKATTEDAICENAFEESEETKSAVQEEAVIEDESFEEFNSDLTPPEEHHSEEKSEEFLNFQVLKEKADTLEQNGGNQGENTNPVEDSEDDDDFGAFQSIPHPPVQEENHVAELVDDDDFGDFAHSSVPAPPVINAPSSAIKLKAQTSEEVIEDFADFQDCSFQSCDVPSFDESSTGPSNTTLISSKIESVIKSLFVIESNQTEGDTSKPNSIDTEISMSSDSTWARVQDFEGSHGLMFKWLSSLTGKRLLRSLNINTTNIVYHEKWGTIEVPKFAASLVQSPLQPQSCNRLDSQAKSIEHPAIVNNNTIISDDHDKPPTLSTEAQEILRQLPDLSYMRANTLVFPQSSSPSGL